MTQLSIINQDGKFLVDSRDVADMTDKQHKDLLRDIRNFSDILLGANLRSVEFFIESTYQDSTGRKLPRYLLTRKGCDMVANKMTGEKGVLFTAEYVTKFEEMENQQSRGLSNLSPQLQLLIAMEQRQNQLETENKAIKGEVANVKQVVEEFADNMTAKPIHTEVVSKVNEYARFARVGHNEVWNMVYDTLKAQHGIDIKQRVANEREKVQNEYRERTGRWYSEASIKKLVNGVDIAVRIGCIDKMNSIISGMLAKEKIRNTLAR